MGELKRVAANRATVELRVETTAPSALRIEAEAKKAEKNMAQLKSVKGEGAAAVAAKLRAELYKNLQTLENAKFSRDVPVLKLAADAAAKLYRELKAEHELWRHQRLNLILQLRAHGATETLPGIYENPERLAKRLAQAANDRGAIYFANFYGELLIAAPNKRGVDKSMEAVLQRLNKEKDHAAFSEFALEVAVRLSRAYKQASDAEAMATD